MSMIVDWVYDIIMVKVICACAGDRSGDGVVRDMVRFKVMFSDSRSWSASCS